MVPHQTQDCRVYQSKSSKDILTQMFQDAGLTDFSFSVSSGTVRPYTIQFNESDYTFAMRLMEQEGWFYYFVHTASKHTLTITDKSSSFPDIPNATLNFASNPNDPAGITEWRPPVRTATGSFAMGDYDPENPGTKLYNKQTTVLKTGGAATRDVYNWPALTATGSVVEARAEIRNRGGRGVDLALSWRQPISRACRRGEVYPEKQSRRHRRRLLRPALGSARRRRQHLDQ